MIVRSQAFPTSPCLSWRACGCFAFSEGNTRWQRYILEVVRFGYARGNFLTLAVSLLTAAHWAVRGLSEDDARHRSGFDQLYE
jgi:hypothetical protein